MAVWLCFSPQPMHEGGSEGRRLYVLNKAYVLYND